MELLSNEKTIQESANGQLVLTTHRVRFDGKNTTGETKIVGIMLDEVSSCELTVKSRPVLLLLAIIFIIVAFTVDGSFLAGLIGAVCLGAAFWLTRKQTMSISSAAASIDVEVKGMSVAKIRELIDSVEKAKFEIRK